LEAGWNSAAWPPGEREDLRRPDRPGCDHVFVSTAVREIPRVWEVNWDIPAAEGGTFWKAYDWVLDTAEQLGVADVSIVASTYAALGGLNWGIGPGEAERLRIQPHRYLVDGLTVHGVALRGGGYPRGVLLVANADDQTLAKIEGHRPAAIAAVAQWPDDVAAWRASYHPARIGQIRPDQEAEYDTTTVETLDLIATKAINSAAAIVNENHSALNTVEREAMAGALVALRDAGLGISPEALRTYLMVKGWNGKLIERTVALAERVTGGQNPRHRPFSLDLA
jgi:hypothetical protein